MAHTERIHSIKQIVLFKALDLLSGHSRPLDPRPTYPPRRRQNHTLGSKEAESSIRPRRTASNYQPPPTFEPLPPRAHCLTPSPSAPDSSYHHQAQSILFNLPPEILSQIYREVLGDSLLHIVRRKAHLGHRVCKIRTPGRQGECMESECRGLKIPSGWHVKPSCETDERVIGLLQTCRKVYMDALEILYTSNVFDFDSMEGLIHFSIAVRARRFDSIQSLQLDFRFNVSVYFSESAPATDFQRWLRTWQIISSMKALRHLWARIHWHRRLISSEEERFLKVLLLVTGLETFDVNVSPLRATEMGRDDWPFHLVRLRQ